MKIAELCIKRPVFACVLNLVLVVVGVVSFKQLDIRYFPNIEQNIITVSTAYSGASAELVENSVTDPLESAVNNIEGLQSINSTSSDGRSTIKLTFNQSADFDEALNQVRDKVSGQRDALPPYPEVTSSTVSSGGVTRPTLNLGFIDKSKTSEQIRDYIDKNVAPILKAVPGVGATSSFGGSDYAMRIWLDSEKMAALDVTVTDVVSTLEQNNIDFPAGTIQGLDRSYSIVSNTRVTSAKEFGSLIIRTDENNVIRLRDISRVEVGYRSLTISPMLINGMQGVDLEVKARSDANPIIVSHDVLATLETLKQNLPQGMDVVVTYDQSKYLKSAIDETVMSLIEAIALVILVVLVFLGSVRAATIPIITIPLCVIDSFGIMGMMGYTINIMTLLALVLAIGLVVDDAIVMLENIHRYIEKGVAPFKAAMIGSKEIALPIVAMTITLAAVYAPIGFSSGLSSAIFKEFAFTLSGTVIVSGFIAITLSPMMASKILKTHQKESRLQLLLNTTFDIISTRYKSFLNFMIKRHLYIVYVFLGCIAIGAITYNSLEQEFIPQEDIGYFNGNATPPKSSTVHYINQQMPLVDAIYKKQDAIQYYATFVITSPTSFVTLTPWDEREISTRQLIDKLNVEAEKLPGLEMNFSVPDAVDITSDSDGNDYSVQVMTTGSYEDLLQASNKVIAALRKHKGFTRVRSSLSFDNLRYKLELNREFVSRLNVSTSDISSTFSTMIGGKHSTDFHLGGESYSVVLQMEKEDLENFSGIQKLYVRNVDGENIPLSSLINITPYVGQSSLNHFMHLRSAKITAQLEDGFTIGKAIEYSDDVIPKLLAENEHYSYSGKAFDFLAASSDMSVTFALALIFIYLILAAQFESFIDPLIILFTVPLSIVGALVCLKVFGGTLNIYTNIGLITLVGLVSKHGILITQFANNLREEGAPLVEALIQAAATRLRPIIMTTMAMVLGALPLALATGPGGNSHKQIGIVVVGGLVFGTFFSLIVVPIAYFYLGRFKKEKRIENAL